MKSERIQQHPRGFITNEHPEYVFLAAAKVGEIYTNNTYPNNLKLAYQDFLKTHGRERNSTLLTFPTMKRGWLKANFHS